MDLYRSNQSIAQSNAHTMWGRNITDSATARAHDLAKQYARDKEQRNQTNLEQTALEMFKHSVTTGHLKGKVDAYKEYKLAQQGKETPSFYERFKSGVKTVQKSLPQTRDAETIEDYMMRGVKTGLTRAREEIQPRLQTAAQQIGETLGIESLERPRFQLGLRDATTRTRAGPGGFLARQRASEEATRGSGGTELTDVSSVRTGDITATREELVDRPIVANQPQNLRDLSSSEVAQQTRSAISLPRGEGARSLASEEETTFSEVPRGQFGTVNPTEAQLRLSSQGSLESINTRGSLSSATTQSPNSILESSGGNLAKDKAEKTKGLRGELEEVGKKGFTNYGGTIMKGLEGVGAAVTFAKATADEVGGWAEADKWTKIGDVGAQIGSTITAAGVLSANPLVGLVGGAFSMGTGAIEDIGEMFEAGAKEHKLKLEEQRQEELALHVSPIAMSTNIIQSAR